MATLSYDIPEYKPRSKSLPEELLLLSIYKNTDNMLDNNSINGIINGGMLRSNSSPSYRNGCSRWLRSSNISPTIRNDELLLWDINTITPVSSVFGSSSSLNEEPNSIQSISSTPEWDNNFDMALIQPSSSNITQQLYTRLTHIQSDNINKLEHIISKQKEIIEKLNNIIVCNATEISYFKQYATFVKYISCINMLCIICLLVKYLEYIY